MLPRGWVGGSGSLGHNSPLNWGGGQLWQARGPRQPGQLPELILELLWIFEVSWSARNVRPAMWMHVYCLLDSLCPVMCLWWGWHVCSLCALGMRSHVFVAWTADVVCCVGMTLCLSAPVSLSSGHVGTLAGWLRKGQELDCGPVTAESLPSGWRPKTGHSCTGLRHQN